MVRTQTYPGMVAYKRPADKGGVPVYQPANSASAAAYQHLMQLQQPFVPVSCKSNSFLTSLSLSLSIRLSNTLESQPQPNKRFFKIILHENVELT